MHLIKLKDAIVLVGEVGSDLVAVAIKFDNLPSALVSVGADLATAVTHWDAAAVQKTLDDVKAARTTLAADAATAGPEFDQLEADVQRLLTLLS